MSSRLFEASPSSQGFATSIAADDARRIPVAHERAGLALPQVLDAVYAAADSSQPLDRALAAVADFVDSDSAELDVHGDEPLAPRRVVRGSIVTGYCARGSYMESPVPSVTPQPHVRLRRSGVSLRFDQGDAERLQILLPHLGRCLFLRGRAAQSGADLAAFDDIGVAALLVDEALWLHAANSRGRSLLQCADGVLETKGRVHTHCPEATRRLLAAVAVARAGAARAPAVALRRERSATPLLARVINAASHAEPRAFLLVTSPDREWRNVPALLHEVYGLSPAEGRLAQMIAEGLAPSDAAAILGTTDNTVRTQLKSIMRKTGTSRQAELVSVLLNGVMRFD